MVTSNREAILIGIGNQASKISGGLFQSLIISLLN